MKIQCNHCGHLETVNKSFIIDLFGLAMPAAGAYAWVTYLFAGTGFAMPICAAIVIGGPILLRFKNEILEAVVNKGYCCPTCNEKDWAAVSNRTKLIKKNHVTQVSENEPENEKVSPNQNSSQTEEQLAVLYDDVDWQQIDKAITFTIPAECYESYLKLMEEIDKADTLKKLKKEKKKANKLLIKERKQNKKVAMDAFKASFENQIN